MFCGGRKELLKVNVRSRRDENKYCSPFPEGNLIGVVSENQRIQPQGGEKHQPVPRGQKMGYFSCGEMMKGLLYLRQQLLKIEMREDYRLEMNVDVFVRRKNVVVGKLDLAVEVIAAAFGIEMEDLVKRDRLRFVLMMVTQAMHAFRGGIAETARHVVVLGAVMELHVPSHRDKQHHKSHY